MSVKFKAKISKMGDNRVIWIPLAMHEMTRELEGKEILVTIDVADWYEPGSQVANV
jgi:hypothetical protein